MTQVSREDARENAREDAREDARGDAQAAPAVETDNPYVGPRPFQKKDSRRFFGRESEARALLSLVESERLVLFYAQSGAGKSSLINAHLIPTLEQHGFAVLPVGRVSGQLVEPAAVKNIYTYNLLLSLDQGGGVSGDPQRLAGMSLRDYLAALPVEDAAAEAEAALPANGELQPLVLVIDQFEELFTTYPAAWEQRGAFFEQLAEAMQADPALWVLLAMREDYVAALDPYARLLPGRLRVRYSMERMGPEAAFRAVTLPVKDLRPFEEQAARDLVTNLRMIVTGRDAENQPVFAAGQFVEPVQLQVVCFQLWEALRSSPGASITPADLERLAQGKELARFVSAALANFYVQALEEVQKQFPQVSERRVREWFGQELITESETRGAVRQGKERTGTPPNDLPNQVVRALQDRFIIRSESRGDTTWYELSHDRFVNPILLSNREWLLHNPQPLELAAQEWLSSGQNPAHLLDGSQLRQAEALLKTHPEEISADARRLIDASQDAASHRSSRRQTMALVWLGLALIVMVWLLISAVRNGQALTLQNATVRAAQQIEIAQKQTITVALGDVSVQKAGVEDANARLLQQNRTVEAASTSVFDQKQTAEAATTLEADQRQRAVAESRLALARELATLAETYLPGQKDLGLLLGVESIQVSDTWEGRRALLDGLQQGLSRQISQDGPPIFGTYPVQSLAFRPDGSQVAIGRNAMPVEVWDFSSKQFLPLPDELKTFSNIYAVSYSPNGKYLVIGDAFYRLAIWNLETGQVKIDKLPNVANDMAFAPSGNPLAIGAVFNHIILWDISAEKQVNIAHSSERSTVFYQVAWSHDGRHLAIGGSHAYLGIWDMDLNQPEPPLLRNVYHEDVQGIAWTPDDQFLISAGYEGRLVRWDVNTRSKVGITDPATFLVPINSMVMSPDGSLLVTGNRSATTPLTLWDPQKLAPLQDNLGGHTSVVLSLAFSPLGDRMASGDSRGNVVFWKVRTQPPLGIQIASLPEGSARALGVDAKGQPFALYGKDKVQAWSAAGTLTVPPLDPSLTNYQVALLADAQGPMIAVAPTGAAEANQPVMLYPLDGSQPRTLLEKTEGAVKALAFSANNAALGVWTERGNQVYTLSDLRNPTRFPAAEVTDFQAATMRADGEIISPLFGLAPGEASGETASKDISRVALSPDGGLLAIGYSNGVIALRGAQGQRPIGQLAWQPDGPIVGLAFAQPAGQPLRLYALTQPGTLMQWDVDLHSWTQRACKLAARQLTSTERTQFVPIGIEYEHGCQ
jgi:WD40 repeat protein